LEGTRPQLILIVDTSIPPVKISDAALAQLLSEVRRHIHRHPETGFREHRTSAYLQELLASRGLTIVEPLAGTGFIVEIDGGQPGPTIGYRAELDALPTADAKTVSYASSDPAAAHLCGHDAHMAIAVGVCLLVDQLRDGLHGSIRVLFQPNEEGIPTGAPVMIADGAIDGLREIFCVHSDPTLEVGKIGIRAGAVTAAAASWIVRLDGGKTGHSARPHDTVDTVWLANQILTSFYQLPGRIHDARRTAVITACRFRAGEALNVIPEKVEVGGTLRSVDPDALKFLSGRMQDVVAHMGAIHGADATYEADLGLPGVVNDDHLVGVVRRTAEDLFGPEAIFDVPEPSMGGEDFAYYLEHIPGMLVRLGTRGGEATGYPLHHSLFDVDERALPIGARLMTKVLQTRLAPPG
jgi:amidohydrolase